MSKNNKFAQLSPEDIEYIKFIYYEEMSHEEKMDILSKKFEVSHRTVRRWWKEELNLSERWLNDIPQQLKDAKVKALPKNTNIVLFTAAQNKTGINTKMLRNLESYKRFLEGLGKKVEIVIAPSRYRNPSSPTEEKGQKTEQWWVDDITEYLYYSKLQFGDTIISTDSRIRPTAKEPLTSYEVLAKDNNLVLPHSKIHFKTLPRFKNKPLRTISTSGFLTRKNYSESRAGEIGGENHAYGFVVIEKKDNGVCHIPRNVKVKSDGSFIDLVYNVTDEQVSTIKDSEGFVWGDIHAAELNNEVFEYTLSLYDKFRPKKTVLHDLLDASTANPHEVKDMFVQRLKITEDRYLIKHEIEHSFEVVDAILATGTEVNVAVSNHDIFLDRLINDGNWKNDLHNSPTYLEMALIQQTVDLRDYGSIYGYMLKQRFPDVNYINYGESLSIEGYECGAHGDHGTNGSRGSYKQFSKLNTKMISGHSHSPVLHNNVTVVGVSCNLHQYYTRKGISSWAYAHSIIHSNGKNQLLVLGDDLKISDLI